MFIQSRLFYADVVIEKNDSILRGLNIILIWLKILRPQEEEKFKEI
jgi:hypothetical protein